MKIHLRLLSDLLPALLLAFLLPGLVLPTAQAATPNNLPGYLDPDELPFIDGRQPNVEVTLSGPVLNMLLQLPIQYDEADQVKELLKAVDQILVRIYTVTDEQADETLGFMGETADTLERQDWMRIVRVREREDSSVDIHVKMSEDGENLNGLVIMAIENDGAESEVVYVNIAGNFNPAYLANIGKQFDIDYLNGVQVP